MNTSRPVEDALDETRPLLHHDENAQGKKPATPLPKGQIAVIMLLSLAEPITSHCIYPFINQLISELDITGGDEKKVGYYVGMIQSIFFAMEALFVFQWSRLSDHIGRKPVLLIGVAGLCVSMICFGLSRTFWGLVVSRSLVGLLNGNTGVTKSMMGEITDETNIAQAFAWMPVAWSVGSTIGPTIGGQLAKPHDRWPSVFSHPFWVKYPYFLPCAASAAFSAFTFVVTAIFLKEASLLTAHFQSVRKRPKRTHPACDEAVVGETHDDAPPPLRKVLTRRVLISVANYGVLALVEIAFLALLPLFFATPVELGGLGFDPPTIGLILGTFGLLNGTIQALLFAKLMDIWGPKRMFQQGLLMFVPLYLLFPIMNLYAKAHGITPVIWGLVFLQQLILVVMDLSFGAIFIFVTSAAANNRCLGATNGIAQLIASIMRAIGPAVATSLFAASLEHNWLGGYGVYPILIAITVSLTLVSTRLPRDMWPKETDHRER
ncbi:MFS general substrate transporter [Pilatotrama ljubarskyi]|nr:MFS general substrate transporter [Pilatotrama ljubarskyi]